MEEAPLMVELLLGLDDAAQQQRSGAVGVVMALVELARRHELTESAVVAGCERAVQVGGEGTPPVGEFLFGEVGAILHCSSESARQQMADALDLYHRHPELFEALSWGDIEVWQAKQIVRASAEVGPGLGATGDRGRLRASAVGRLSRWALMESALPGIGPDDRVPRWVPSFGDAEAGGEHAGTSAARPGVGQGVGWAGERLGGNSRSGGLPAESTRRAVIVIHLDPANVTSSIPRAVPEVEPAGLTEMAPTGCVVNPATDDDSYGAGLVGCGAPGGALAPGTLASGRCELDHTIPYDPEGPPGQTSPRNLGPLSRYHHRLKTFAGWTVQHYGPGYYGWRSPHGFEFKVTPRGTTLSGRPYREPQRPTPPLARGSQPAPF